MARIHVLIMMAIAVAVGKVLRIFYFILFFSPYCILFYYYFRWGYSFLSNRYQFTWSGRLGHDAELFWSPLHVGFGEARKIWWTSTILCNSSTNRIKKASWKLCLQVYFAITCTFMYEHFPFFHSFSPTNLVVFQSFPVSYHASL